MNDVIMSIILISTLILLVIFIFIRISMRVRKNGGNMTTTMFASTYEFLNKDKRDAVEEIVETNANKKMEEEATDKPKYDT